ncbi:MAG: LptF/LptG family permease [Candidatus Omnitrophota bacterium]|nr:LptF/LptG family permease [Candidatus Omnitrophota bacterium]
MRILRNYLLKEYFSPLLMALGVLIFVMLLGNLIKITNLIINKGVDPVSVMKLFGFLVPYLLSYTLPVAALSAVLLSLGRLSGDNEIIAIRASGISLLHLTIPLLTVGLVFSLALVVMNDRLIPYAHFESRKTLTEIGVKNPTAVLEPGVFIDSFERYVIFIYRIDVKENKLYNIRIYEPQEGNKPTRTIIAKRGEFIPDMEKKVVKFKLIDGTSDEPDPKNPANFYKLNFKTYFMTLNLTQGGQKKVIDKKPKDMTLKELKAQIKKYKSMQVDTTPLITEFHGKISLAFSCFAFVLLGIPLAIITRRKEKAVNFALAFFIVGVYYLLLLGGEALSLQKILPPALAMWAPNIILGSLGIFLNYRLCKH